MAYDAQYLTQEEWMNLHTAYLSHRADSFFWDIYQALMDEATRRTGQGIHVANELAGAAMQFGATRAAHFVK